MKRLRALLAGLDRQDAVILSGLSLLFGGLSVVHVALACIVVGSLLFLVGVGAFVPRPGPGGVR